MRRLLVRLRRASERGGRDLQQRFSMLTAISVAIAVLVVGTMDRIGFTTTDYAKRHHGGYLGSKSRQLSRKEAEA